MVSFFISAFLLPEYSVITYGIAIILLCSVLGLYYFVPKKVIKNQKNKGSKSNNTIMKTVKFSKSLVFKIEFRYKPNKK